MASIPNTKHMTNKNTPSNLFLKIIVRLAEDKNEKSDGTGSDFLPLQLARLQNYEN